MVTPPGRPLDPTTPDPAGLDSIAAAAAACRATGHTGWELVDRAASLVHARFTTYSVRHPWECADTAYRRRRGYCTQYNGALAVLLRRLGFDAWLVCAARVRLHDDPGWTLGHTWVRVRVDGEVRDVCARRSANRAGDINLTPVGAVRPLGRATRVLSTAGTHLAALAAVLGSRWHHRPRPEWVEHPRRTG